MRKVKASFFLFIFTLGFSSAQSQEIVWDGQQSKMPFADQVEVFKGESESISIEEIAAPSNKAFFERSTQKLLDFPFESGVKWIKFKVKNESKDQLLLEVFQPILPEVTLYYQDPTGSWVSIQSGYETNIYAGDITQHTPIFKLDASQSEYYLRITTTGQPMPIVLWEEKAFEVNQTHRLLTFGLYLGIMLFIVLQNLFFFVSLKRFENFNYAMIIFGYTFFSSIYEGYILYIIPKLDLWVWLISIPNLLSPNVLIYCLLFLGVKKIDPKMYKVGLGFLVYFVLCIVLCQILPRITAHLFNQFNALLGLCVFTYIGFRSYKRGNQLGFYYALAYLLFLIISTIEVVYTKTGSPSYFIDLSYISIAFLIEIVILSYLLSKRLEWEKIENEKLTIEAQRQLLEKTKENERMALEQSVTLEKEVKVRTADLNKSLRELKATQAQLIQSEKMASLGELTAGIAHEIQNPLNFVNNFSEVTGELVEELEEEGTKELGNRDKELEKGLIHDIKENLKKINHHGNRASSIVKGMLEHSRTSTGKKELTDLNLLTDEYLRLSYHGLRAKDKSFNAEIITNFDPEIPQIKIVSQDIGRVLLNLINNAFQALDEKSKKGIEGFRPKITVSTKADKQHFLVSIKDNGPGIPHKIKDKIFQPFFTTKETGKGTGLGLSLSNEIIKSHGGEIRVVCKGGEGTEFVVVMPKN